MNRFFIKQGSTVQTNRDPYLLDLILVAAFGLYWGYISIGPVGLDTNSLEWLRGDLAQVYTAWGQYFSDPGSQWLSTNRMSYPIPMSIALFDPMPLLLLLASPFVDFVKDGQQFIGVYFVSCLALQGIFGYLAARQALRLVHVENKVLARYLAVLVGVLLVSIPYTMFRFMAHTALSSQWVLVLSIWGTLITLSSGTRRWMIINCTVLCIATGLNPYLAMMIFVSDSVVLLCRWKIDGFKLKTALLYIFALVVTTAIGLTLFGFMGAAGTASGGYGYYSMNILGPIDSNGMAGLFRLDIPDATGLQSFEGFTYIGLGLLLLTVIVLLSYVNYHNHRQHSFPFIPAIAVVVCCYLLALSTTITLASSTLFLPVPDTINWALSRFRSSGRIFWMGGFWLVLILVAATILRFGARRAALILSFILVVQIVDVRAVALNIQSNIANFKAWRFQEPGLNEVNSILVYPPRQCDNKDTPGGSRNFELVGYFALENNIYTNNFYAARTPKEQTSYHCNYNERLEQLDSGALYLLSSTIYTQYQDKFRKQFSCSEIGDIWVCKPSGIGSHVDAN